MHKLPVENVSPNNDCRYLGTDKKAEPQRIDAFELWCWRRLLKIPWTVRRPNQSILKDIKSWVFIGRTYVEAEIPILWPPHVKSWLIGKDPNAGKDWGQEEKGMTEDEMAGWHHWLYGHESEWTAGVGDGQGGLASCSSWCLKELDTTEQLNWTQLMTQKSSPFHPKALLFPTSGIQTYHWRGRASDDGMEDTVTASAPNQYKPLLVHWP